MLTRPLRAAGELLALLGQRSTNTWITRSEWEARFPAEWDRALVGGECAQLGLIQLQEPQGCALCDRDEQDHEEADHAFSAQTAAVRLEPAGLVARVLERLRDLEPEISAGPITAFASGPSYFAEAKWQDTEFIALLHLGLDAPALPSDTRGRPVVHVDFRGASSAADPPARRFHWVDLLEEQGDRERALSHIRSLSDPSFLSLHDVADGLGTSATEPVDALALFLMRCYFKVERTEVLSGYADRARLAPTARAHFVRNGDVIVDCGCTARVGWHIHGFRNGQRKSPLVIEPRLHKYLEAASRTSRTYRDLRAGRERVPGIDRDLWKDGAAAIATVSAFGTFVLSQELKQGLSGLLTAQQLEAASVAVAGAGALFLTAPRAWLAWLGFRIWGLHWPNRPD